MSTYILKKPFKTRVLNFIRKLFTNTFIERIIVKKMDVENPSGFWTKMVPPNYLYRSQSIRKVSRNNINYILDISNVVDHFIYFGFKERSFESIEEKIKKATVIFDVGANIGSTAMYFSSLNRSGKIYAFEPHPHTFERAMNNLEINEFKNIELHKIGFGDKPDVVKLYEVNPNNPGMNRVISKNIDLPFVTITIDTIDNFLQEKNINKVDLVKIDVEGFEFNVLSGAKKLLQEQKPVLFIELDDDNLRDNDHSAVALVSFLYECGYSSFYRADTNTPVSMSTDFTSCHYDIIVM